MSWSRWWQRLSGRVIALEIEDSAWAELIASSALFQRLDADNQRRLRHLCGCFLASKSFSAAAGHELQQAQCLAIAALACLPVMQCGFDALAGWHEVIVYPGEFRVREQHHDEHTGVVTESDDERIGEAWERGPVILSWADIAADLQQPFDGFNVVVHEIAHKLDMGDGVMNGMPLLPPAILRERWITAMQAGFDDLTELLERAQDTLIDPYASESAAEYFAVVSELYFSDPGCLQDASADVAALLREFYGASPAA